MDLGVASPGTIADDAPADPPLERRDLPRSGSHLVAVTPRPSPNFAFLGHHDPRLVALGTQAEEHFATDPAISLFKLRQFGEVLAKRAAAKVGMLADPTEGQQQLVDQLFRRNVIGATQRALFHDLRRVGNAAVHEGKGDAREALHQLRMSRELAIWFQRTFGNNRKFDPGPFVPPAEPGKTDTLLHQELQRLRDEAAARAAEVEAAKKAVDHARNAAEAEAAQRLSAQQIAEKARSEAAIWEALANEQIEEHRNSADAHVARSRALEEQNKKLLAELASAQAAAVAMPPAVLEKTIERAAEASEAIEVDEAATRKIIDRQLQKQGWDADSERLTFDRGIRPTKGKNLAIAEWPTRDGKDAGRADYVLFADLQAIAVVEAKRKHKDVMGVIPQAKRYSVGYQIKADETLPEGSPWGRYKIPFLFATNGRPYLRQLRMKSGIWFLDARRPGNHPVVLEDWYTPEGLVDLLKQDVDRAYAALKVEPMPYIDREYQRNAILAVEKGLEEGKREMLVAMATGTGKTRTCIGLCYRLLKTRRFRRVLFLVDRNALGTQTNDVLKDLRLENLQTFTDIFDVKGLADVKPERDTRFHIATVQAMVKRVLGPHDEASEENIPPVDAYDCIVVDECHRGYVLDREMSDREMHFRDEADYISQYRRVLDHFDAVKVGLTATPALHTKEIFGAPVFSYSYREAVVDGFLVDHEPPTRIVTKLAEDGIHYKAKEEITVVDRVTQTLKKEELADEVSFDVDSFNRRVITENFNRAVIGELVKHIDPEQDEKTLVFCATDEHADLVVVLLKEAFRARYGAVDDDAIAKITGATDHPLQAIRRYRNERLPNVAVTVDLLSTGIDIPKIANLVFLRRVRSRILYEQMLGRATRLCPEIGKERFRVFDAVDLYSAIKDVTDMKPVVVDPVVTFEQLAKEIMEGTDDDDRQTSLRELLAKLQRKKSHVKGEREEQFATAAGMSVTELLEHLKTASVGEAASWLQSHASVTTLLDRVTGGVGYRQILSDHDDEIRQVTTGYGHGTKRPEDYLESFRAFVRAHLNTLPALLVVTQRPRDLTRDDLRRLKLTLDEQGYTEKALQTAWRETKNEDFAATIIGYIRRLALGSPLRAYDARVDGAVQRMMRQHKFTDPQRKWLERIGEQMKVETVVDRESLDRGQFQSVGGFARLNKTFDGALESLLGELADEVWRDAG
jgi:type I restriction enzyme R subunit